MPRSTMAVLCIAAALAAAPVALRAEDWPRWGRRDDGNMVSDEKGLPGSFHTGKQKDRGWAVDLSTTTNVKWAARLGSQTYGNPVVSGGKVLVGTNDASLRDPRFKRTGGGVVMCLDEDTGAPIWQLVVPRFRTTEKSFNYDDMHLGICAAATIEGDRAYVLTNRGEAVCLDLSGLANGNDGPFQDEGKFMADQGQGPIELKKDTDADIIWTFDMVHDLPVWPQDASSGSPLVHGDLVYVPTSNGVDRSHSRVPYPDSPSLIVLDKKTGRMVAKDDEKIGRRLFHGQWSTPTLGVVNGKALILYGAGDGVCYAFEPPQPPKEPGEVAILKKVWWADCNAKELKFKDGKPVRYDKKHRNFSVAERGTGPSEITATPVFHKNRVYVTVGQDPRHGQGSGCLTCIDATKTGDVTETGRLWQSTLVDRSLSTVSIAEGLLYVADFSGRIHCFDAETGQRYWVHETGAPLWSSTLVADGKVYLGTENKDLWVFQAGKEDKLLGKVRLEEKMSNTPIVANGVLYVATGRYLYAVQSPPTAAK